ncbi:MAG TPA: AAA family ATPase, partial [Bacilli bacterium]|nr:AAA family ATPase [Bacilli bacterium]
MYLKQIIANGFKSFADKTNIEFNKSIAGIVGPNGSGKSNIVDAVRWVLGEQSIKSLRGTNMSDVIFSGSKTRGASTCATVTLIFDNTDNMLPIEYSEVAIKRTIYKTGESEYYLNNEKCRLKDITDLFIDAGVSKESFNIISQGDIATILSDKAEDRRIIFDAASGVLKYKKKKEEALRKLEKTNNNLIRVNDIINEIESNLDPLFEQSKVAKKYLECKELLDDLEVALIVTDIEKLNDNVIDCNEKIKVLNDQIFDMETNSNIGSTNLEELKLKYNKINDELYNKQQELLSLVTEVEKLSGDKNLIIERQKYKSDDIKIHNNVINLKEELLKIDNELSIS